MKANQETTIIKPYGDTLNDGMMQLSFTLPIPISETAKEAARQMADQMGLDEAQVVHASDLGVGYTFFVVYGRCRYTVDLSTIKVSKVTEKSMTHDEVEDFIADHLKRTVTIVGACTGTDAHTVGIDAIMNMKGFDGHYGLERYKGINAINLGAQVPNEVLIAKAVESNADAILVSQIVTQKDVHIPNLTQLIELLETEGLRDKIIVCAGGPRISNELAKELGYDAGFGSGTFAEDVATFVVEKMASIGDVSGDAAR
ncbi:cobalamin-dependent protein [Fusibacter paucivorans]|uniref:Cobalamin-dependent protein n=1 Tax=Fusibacter paucivorans TaxID=76009 RepID=A0ABS5PNW1_9FIRM|nr:OAM dimerization domain-containing protein [Fusibacter paucivorans]MBS7526582.1 cobalamin-dependent protein [Fusibacter paucivorans]